ncbi:MAG: nitrous oxide reductase accessory protein NosL [Thermodesulfobacteriota bacterium]
MNNIILSLVVFLFLAGPAPVGAEPLDPVEADSRCPVCGMFVAKYDVWITQIRYDEKVVLSFDGVKDMMAFYHSPASFGGRDQKDIKEIWVKDYYSLKWIDGRQAFFVLGSDVHGPMGHEFVPFVAKAAAEAFLIDHHGRQVMSFAEITPAQVEKLRVGNKMKNMKK